ncbi:MAG: hypothetical protein B7Z27_04760, partial [Sphingobacteriia bacterium 32-37-4]
MYKLLNLADYSLSKFTVEHALDFVQGMDKISQLIRFENGSVLLNQTAERIQQLLNKETVQEMIQANKKSLFPVTILKFAQFLRTRYKNATEELIEILRNSEVYARLKTQVMYCFESKYALCLYEMIERRIGLEYKQSEEFTIAELRGLLNVPEGKLERFADFNKYCLKVAQEEINKLCPFWVEFTPIKKGRKVERVS